MLAEDTDAVEGVPPIMIESVMFVSPFFGSCDQNKQTYGTARFVVFVVTLITGVAPSPWLPDYPSTMVLVSEGFQSSH